MSNNQNHWFPIALLSVLLMALAWNAAASQTTDNLVSNPGFEKDLSGWETSGPAQFAIDPNQRHSAAGCFLTRQPAE